MKVKFFEDAKEDHDYSCPEEMIAAYLDDYMTAVLKHVGTGEVYKSYKEKKNERDTVTVTG